MFCSLKLPDSFFLSVDMLGGLSISELGCSLLLPNEVLNIWFAWVIFWMLAPGAWPVESLATPDYFKFLILLILSMISCFLFGFLLTSFCEDSRLGLMRNSEFLLSEHW
jgi:hypothetical protein